MNEFVKGKQYSFENFIVTEDNRSAYDLARRFADIKSDMKECTIYGASGTGKTHLLYAVRNQLEKIEPPLKVLFYTSQEIDEELCMDYFFFYVKKDDGDYFKNYVNCDVLLIDDIQKIRQKELYYSLLNELMWYGKRIMYTSSGFPSVRKFNTGNSYKNQRMVLESNISSRGSCHESNPEDCAVINKAWITVPADCVCLYR